MVLDSSCYSTPSSSTIVSHAKKPRSMIVNMTKMTLKSLPLEILQQVASSVETVHKPSLRAFSLINKACHEASVHLIFRQISITVRDREGIRRDVDGLNEALSRTKSFRHIHQITIKGALKLKDKKVEGYGPRTPWSVTCGLDEILNEEKISWTGLWAVYDEAVIEKSSEADMAWAPVVNLLQGATQLKDLVYDCQSQFPPSLLKTLHEERPECRLHHLTFRFRTLLWGHPKPYEMELATSPSLYRVKLVCGERDSDGDDDFNLEAMMELAAGLAPNLKDVTVLNIEPAGCHRGTRPREKWRGLPGFESGSLGSLTSLSLKGFSHFNVPEKLQVWARHTDFACLQHLTLGGCTEAERSGLSGETMEWAGRTQSFPQIKTLSVYLKRDNEYQERPHYSEYAISFFQAFRSLEKLCIDGPIDSKILDSVLSHHGQTLKTLCLRPFENSLLPPNSRDLQEIPLLFTKDRIVQIRTQCPVLQELMIPVQRDKSSASEVELYRYLAGIESLQSLFIILDCSNWRVTRDPTYKPEFDGPDQVQLDYPHFPYVRLSKGELKSTFINCAVDEALARSIWDVINQNKAGRQLERLKLWPTGAGSYGDSYGLPTTFRGMANNMCRSWLLERIPRDDKEDFSIRELRMASRKAWDQQEERYLTCRHDPQVWEVLESIWPPTEESKDWRDNWSSTPLAV